MDFTRRGFIGTMGVSTAGIAAVRGARTTSARGSRAMSLPTVATPLSVSGRWIVDANGVRVKLAGVNWAGAHEDNMVAGGLAFLNRNTIAEQVASWGFNSVRLTFSANTILSASPIPSSSVAANTDMVGMTPWQAYQAVASALTSAGVMVIPNMQSMYQGWCCALTDGNGLWWNGNWSYATVQAAWTTVVQAFAGNPLVVGYDLKNEPRQATISGTTYVPTWGSGTSGAKGTDFQWFYTQLGNAIQVVDSTKLLICEGTNSASALNYAGTKPVAPTHAGKVLYSVHDYPQGWLSDMSYSTYSTTWQDNAAFLMTEGKAPVWVGEFGLANDSMAALGLAPVGAGNGMGAGPTTQTYGPWWSNFKQFWGQNGLDADWCAWHLSGTHVKGTQPSTNALQYNEGDRCWDGIYAQDWQGPASQAQLEQIQTLMPPLQGPGLAGRAKAKVPAK